MMSASKTSTKSAIQQAVTKTSPQPMPETEHWHFEKGKPVMDFLQRAESEREISPEEHTIRPSAVAGGSQWVQVSSKTEKETPVKIEQIGKMSSESVKVMNEEHKIQSVKTEKVLKQATSIEGGCEDIEVDRPVKIEKILETDESVHLKQQPDTKPIDSNEFEKEISPDKTDEATDAPMTAHIKLDRKSENAKEIEREISPEEEEESGDAPLKLRIKLGCVKHETKSKVISETHFEQKITETTGHVEVMEKSEPPKSVLLYDEAIRPAVDEFSQLSKKIGGHVEQVSGLFNRCVSAQREFLWQAASLPKPTKDSELADMLKATSQAIEKLTEFRKDNRKSEFFNHLSAVSESVAALGWVTVSPAPAPYVKEMSDAAMFYTNRVLKDYKDKDTTHVAWCKSWQSILTSLHQYVKANHTTGVVWNQAPGCYNKGAAAKVAAAGPPPPPPPPPPAVADLSSGGSGDSARAALFAEINKGADITKGLKTVTDDMKTHKNPKLREQNGAVKEKTPPPIPQKPANLAQSQTKPKADSPPPKCELEAGKKWVVEFQKNNRECVIENTDMKQVVYIYKCVNSVIVIKGKVNSVTMDSCKKTSVVFDALVSQMETINCQSVQVQTMGSMPTLCIQKTDGCQVYLSKDSLDAQIVSSKSSEMNVLVPKENGEFSEHPLPEQYKSIWNGKLFKTEAVDIA